MAKLNRECSLTARPNGVQVFHQRSLERVVSRVPNLMVLETSLACSLFIGGNNCICGFRFQLKQEWNYFSPNILQSCDGLCMNLFLNVDAVTLPNVSTLNLAVIFMPPSYIVILL